ncbi:hypothetical protein FH593_03465 [Leptospira interrogans]|nr:hypothetical protein [Leptospira interrogans]ULG86153.1 hypothetical protein FH594_17265 [Leptospira interrogans]ULG90291.1 hypothetical protein FH593_03465 [Leptospira interrogans]
MGNIVFAVQSFGGESLPLAAAEYSVSASATPSPGQFFCFQDPDSNSH